MSSGDLVADRVAGADESYALAERLFGWTAPIQYMWIFPADPGADVVATLVDALAAGSFDRKVKAASVPLAHDRWVRARRPAPLRIEPGTIDDAAVGDWMDERLRAVDLDPRAGRGFTVECAHTTSGRFVMALLVSHMIADGQAVYAALDAARTGRSRSSLPDAEDVSGWRGVRDDVRDVGAQVPAVLTSLAVIGRAAVRAGASALRQSLLDRSAATEVAAPTASPTTEPTARPRDSETTLAVVDLDRAQWARRAADLGGTPNSLFTAILGGLLRSTGYPMGPEGTRICIAVSNRTDGDERANASGGVWIRVPGPIEPERGLGEIRASSKAAFAANAAADDFVQRHLQPVARLLPDRVLGTMMKSVPGPDTTVSNLGSAPRSALELGDQVAESFAIRAIMQGRDAAERRQQGPAIAAWAVEYGDKVTVTVFGIHPDYAGDTDTVRALVSAELTRWSLDHSFW
jgi:diacylglycerol O-acyltransferase